MPRKKRRTRKSNGAGSITKLSGYRSKPWMVRTAAQLQIDGTMKRVILGYYATSEEAEIALAKYKINPSNIEEKNITLGEMFEIWLTKKKSEVTAERSWKCYLKAFEAHLNHLKDRSIRGIQFNELQQPLLNIAIGTSKSLKIALVGLFNEAIKNNILEKNIATLLETSKNKFIEKKNTIFSNELIKKIRFFANTSNDTRMVKMAEMTLIMLYTGMRAGEIRTIEKENIFLDDNYMIGGIKTDAGKDRVIVIHPKIKDLITKYYNEYPNKKYLFSQERSSRAFSEVTFTNNFIEFRKLLGFTHNRHETRHTFITHLKKLSISESKIKKIVGHSTSDVTDGVYTHYEPKDLLSEILKLDYGD